MDNEERVIKVRAENDLLFFSKYIFAEQHRKLWLTPYHIIEITKALERVYSLETKRLIINIPPRYGKTELVIKIFIAWCLAKIETAKFIHLSYSDSLALDNSSQTKEYIQSDAFQNLWPQELKRDAQGKQKWYNKRGGGVYATSTGGAITGFGAGGIDENVFEGAIIIDDPIKPTDAISAVKRNTINERYNNTISSRVNNRNVPIVLIMQRLHEDDLSGFLLNGGSGEEWEHLCLPALDENNKPLWKEKHTFKELEQIRQADRYNFNGQYMQTPSPDEGGEWKRNWFEIINKNDIPSGVRWDMIIDGAYTKSTQNDPTGIQIATRIGDNYVILSSIDKYLEMPELIRFIPQHIDALGIDIRMIYVEPKASGKSIVQLIRDRTRLNIADIKSDFVAMSKIERARMTSPYIEGGRVKLIKGAWNEHFLNQVSMFPNGKHDEHIDTTCYGVDQHLMRSFGIEIR